MNNLLKDLFKPVTGHSQVLTFRIRVEQGVISIKVFSTHLYIQTWSLTIKCSFVSFPGHHFFGVLSLLPYIRFACYKLHRDAVINRQHLYIESSCIYNTMHFLIRTMQYNCPLSSPVIVVPWCGTIN